MWAGCGARTELAMPLDAATRDAPPPGADVCTRAPTCSGYLRGTWRLSTPTRPIAGYFVMYDAPGCPGGESRVLLRVEMRDGGEACYRYGGFRTELADERWFRVSADNLGGTFPARCGGSPSGESLRYEMRWDCARGRYELTVEHNRSPSLYAGTYEATRCACTGAQSVCPRIFAPDPCNP